MTEWKLVYHLWYPLLPFWLLKCWSDELSWTKMLFKDLCKLIYHKSSWVVICRSKGFELSKWWPCSDKFDFFIVEFPLSSPALKIYFHSVSVSRSTSLLPSTDVLISCTGNTVKLHNCRMRKLICWKAYQFGTWNQELSTIRCKSLNCPIFSWTCSCLFFCQLTE